MRARRVAVAMASVVVSACSAFGLRSGTEQPPYAVLATPAADVEVRRYPPRLVAEVVVTGDEEAARSLGFRKLAAFIFGENEPRRTIAMTAPVAQGAAAPERIAMTAPVGQAAEGDGHWRIRFFMPSAYTLATLPAPTDPDIRVAEVAATTVAAIRFSGVPTPGAVAAETGRLRQALADTPWQAKGTPETFFYDPPWTLPLLRRNEVVVTVMEAPTAGNAATKAAY